MNLPVRIVRERPQEPVVCVDGVFGAPGLELSHWPGNRTPPELVHPLSTGIALNFARLAPDRREALARGTVAIVNNHYDTDGACAAFALRHPARALAIETELLDVARAGDLYEVPGARAVQLDFLVGNLCDPGRSPLDLAAGNDLARWNTAQDWLLENLDRLVAGALEEHSELFEVEWEQLQEDRSELEAAEQHVEAPLDLAVFHRRGTSAFDPGRHALFANGRHDRALALGSTADGTTARFVLSTRSWFDFQRPTAPRPDLGRLAERLNELEGTPAEAACAWRAQAVTNASPELWFGRDGLASFAEHNGRLTPSRLAPRTIEQALRAELAALAEAP